MNTVSAPAASFPRAIVARLAPALPYAVVVASVLLVYANALLAGFVADARAYLAVASCPRSLAELGTFFTTPAPLNPVHAPVGTKLHRPAFFLYGTLAYHVWGTPPWAWHAASILLHAAATCLVLTALRRLFGLSGGAAFLVALLWAVHPVHVEAVTYVTGVNYLLPGLFVLLAVLIACGWWPTRLPASTQAARG